MESLPLDELISSRDIAIQTLSVMLYVCFGAIIGMAWFIWLLVYNFRKDMKEAWGYVSKLSDALKAKAEDIAVIKSIAQRLDGQDRRDQAPRRSGD